MKDLLKYAREARQLGINSYDVIANVYDDERDFEVEGYRFIHEDDILTIMVDELSGDEYMLGCFNADFISGHVGISALAIQKMQKAEAFEGVGEMILAHADMEAFTEAYANADGYGHHFAHYDGEERDIGDYYYFRV